MKFSVLGWRHSSRHCAGDAAFALCRALPTQLITASGGTLLLLIPKNQLPSPNRPSFDQASLFAPIAWLTAYWAACAIDLPYPDRRFPRLVLPSLLALSIITATSAPAPSLFQRWFHMKPDASSYELRCQRYARWYWYHLNWGYGASCRFHRWRAATDQQKVAFSLLPALHHRRRLCHVAGQGSTACDIQPFFVANVIVSHRSSRKELTRIHQSATQYKAIHSLRLHCKWTFRAWRTLNVHLFSGLFNWCIYHSGISSN